MWGAIALASTIALGVRPVCAQEALPSDAEPLTAVELFMLVEDHSWKWSEGAGRFFNKDRRFLAFTRAKDGASFGEGRFLVTDSGRLCLVATWHGAAASNEARTCFLHKQADGVIYQRREPSGDWYVLKHSPVRETDEYAKFTKEDLVSEEFLKLKAEMETSSSAKERK
ncbi:MAG: DUF995 domain-containing protein [Hydrogenophaga sp.]|nr:DUF995 domain-containing protein [Hydrogenophaga sp.]